MENETTERIPILEIAWTRYAIFDATAKRRTRGFYNIRATILWLSVIATIFAIVNTALFAERNFDPVDLAADVVVGIVGAHRAAEKHRTGMLIERAGQRIAKARPADVETMAQRTQRVADAARR